jgi:hypothetical protein
MYDDLLGKKTEKTSEKIEMLQYKKCKRCNKYYAQFIENQECPYCSKDVITGLWYPPAGFKRGEIYVYYAPYIPLGISKFKYNKECPKCGSSNIEAVEPFDYVKQCKDCKHQFVSGEHN